LASERNFEYRKPINQQQQQQQLTMHKKRAFVHQKRKNNMDTNNNNNKKRVHGNACQRIATATNRPWLMRFDDLVTEFNLAQSKVHRRGRLAATEEGRPRVIDQYCMSVTATTSTLKLGPVHVQCVFFPAVCYFDRIRAALLRPNRPTPLLRQLDHTSLAVLCLYISEKIFWSERRYHFKTLSRYCGNNPVPALFKSHQTALELEFYELIEWDIDENANAYQIVEVLLAISETDVKRKVQSTTLQELSAYLVITSAYDAEMSPLNVSPVAVAVAALSITLATAGLDAWAYQISARLYGIELCRSEVELCIRRIVHTWNHIGESELRWAKRFLGNVTLGVAEEDAQQLADTIVSYHKEIPFASPTF
jgi:hypothetical protein